MKYLIQNTLIGLILLSVNLNAQNISSDSYNTKLIYEDFNQDNNCFKIITTSDNYFILDNGDYLLSRNNKDSEYAIIANNSLVTNFVLKTLVRIGPSENKQASLGVILKYQQSEKGGIIFEINKRGEYRIKQLLGDTYKEISGNNKQEGWVRNKIINLVDEHNLIEIRTEDNIYDIYINKKYLTTFFIDYHTSGTCGLIISPETKARISYYYLNTDENKEPIVSYNNSNTKSINKTTEVLNTENKNQEKPDLRIATLKNKNTELKQKNITLSEKVAGLKEQLSKNMNENTDLAVSTSEQKKNISRLSSTISNLRNQNTTLSQEVEELENKIDNIKTKNSERAAILSEEVEKLKAKRNNIKAKNTDLAAITIKQEQEIKSLTTTNNNLTNSSNEATTKSQELKQEISSLKQEISLEKSINTELTSDLDKVKESLNNQISQLNNKVKDLEASNSNLSDALSNEKSAHKKAKNGLSTTVKNKTAEVKKLSSELNNVNNEIASLRLTQAKHDKVTNNLNTQITELNNKINLINNQLDISNNDLATLEATNAELKELFILKDFELNGIKPSEIVKETSNTPPPPTILKNTNTFYTIQVGVFMKEQVNTSIRSLDNFWYITSNNGTYVYYSGEFNSPEEATEYKNKVAKLGYPEAFVTTLTR